MFISQVSKCHIARRRKEPQGKLMGFKLSFNCYYKWFGVAFNVVCYQKFNYTYVHDWDQPLS